ncbi:peptidase M24, structural domain-containing protein [Limtongia smithiae]|uniref:peptidase M24, structural domain-containing protein n=1 Tax=Limtongia smithiae TaxID=1125753 RepID=UPI0034CF7348
MFQGFQRSFRCSAKGRSAFAGLMKSVRRNVSTSKSTPASMSCAKLRHERNVNLRATTKRYCLHSRGYATEEVQAGFGQPTHETRPHMLEAGELTPGITALEYHTRRSKLAAKLPTGGVAILVGSEIKYRSGAVFYEFHQNPDFFYLSGFNEPLAVIAIEKLEDDDFVFHMFVQPKDERKELWEGPRTGVQGAIDVFNADEAGDIADLRVFLKQIVARSSSVYFDIPPHAHMHPSAGQQKSSAAQILEVVKHHNKAIRGLTSLVQDLRAIKSDSELAVMQTAGLISGRAITDAYGTRWKRESDLFAYLDFKFRVGGCEKSAYVPVVAGGKNALGIHYTRNDDVLTDGEMVLIDAGGQYGGYCADISRAWPVNGKFTGPQRDLYQAILNVQEACIKLSTTASSLESIHRASEDYFVTELRNIGFTVSPYDIRTILYPHYIGHHLGLDVHDCPMLSRRQLLRNGNVITIEPGIYVPWGDPRFPKHFWGIGIRIEDNVFVDNSTPVVISSSAAKEIADVEEAAQKFSDYGAYL